MSITDWLLVIIITTLLAFAIYDQFIMPHRKGKVLLAIPLLRRSRVDGIIFVGLVCILIYQNINNNGQHVTTWLLCALALMGFYLFWIRSPRIIFKTDGFFFSGVWFAWARIKGMNLSEDGVLIMQLEHRRLLVRAKNIDDLELIYELLIKSQ